MKRLKFIKNLLLASCLLVIWAATTNSLAEDWRSFDKTSMQQLSKFSNFKLQLAPLAMINMHATLPSIASRALQNIARDSGQNNNCHFLAEGPAYSWKTKKIVEVQQICDQQPVYSAGSKVIFNRQQKIEKIVGHLAQRVESFDAAQLLDLKAVKETVYQELQIVNEQELKTFNSEEVLLEQSGSDYLVPAYKITAELFDPYLYRVYFISRIDGTIIARKNQIFSGQYVNHIDRRNLRSSRGKANVFWQNPREDKFITKTEILRDLVGNNNRLQNRFYKVINDLEPSIFRLDNDFRVGWDGFLNTSSHFAEVQVYYALGKIFDFVYRLGFDPKRDAAGQTYTLPVHVHSTEVSNNAFYNGLEIHLGDGDNSEYYSFALDNDIVWHEFGHYIVDRYDAFRAYDGMNFGAALHEGYADYFALATRGVKADIENDYQVAEGVRVDGEPLREVDVWMPYDEYIYYDGRDEVLRKSVKNEDPHFLGLIWVSALWQLRKQLIEEIGIVKEGGYLTDRLVFASLLYFETSGINKTPTFGDAYRALLRANQQLFQGEKSRELREENERQIRKVFETRGYPPLDP